MRTFWFHYNKPKSQQLKTDILTVHFDHKCHFVTDIVCNVPTRTKHNKRQPRVVIIGKCSSLSIENGVAKIS